MQWFHLKKETVCFLNLVCCLSIVIKMERFLLVLILLKNVVF